MGSGSIFSALFLFTSMRKPSQRRLLSPATTRLTPREFDALDAAARLAGTSRAGILRDGGLALAQEVVERLQKVAITA
jgi:uncharacterized protein (DUF1778 family)